jgi:predicted alpha/beta superfamily hydrolase
MIRMLLRLAFAALALPFAPAASAAAAGKSEPLVVGETFTLESAALHETRCINVYVAPAPAGRPAPPRLALYMPDGGLGEDFLHVAGLVQVGVANGTMRPTLLVGIENTERRRDLTGPTDDPEDRKIAPRVGGSAAFRQFLREELMPEIRRRYGAPARTAIVGESLAGLFVVETFLREPDLFDTYIALDPSLWWNRGRLVADAPALLRTGARGGKAVFLANGSQPQIAAATRAFESALAAAGVAGLSHAYVPFPQETHATIYHPAALRAFRTMLAPPKG